jgi:hypothetical protein
MKEILTPRDLLRHYRDDILPTDEVFLHARKPLDSNAVSEIA